MLYSSLEQIGPYYENLIIIGWRRLCNDKSQLRFNKSLCGIEIRGERLLVNDEDEVHIIHNLYWPEQTDDI